jgi:peptidoglycan biosynthesis protein MviN/MurJ (putative lipid II flippase)
VFFSSPSLALTKGGAIMSIFYQLLFSCGFFLLGCAGISIGLSYLPSRDFRPRTVMSRIAACGAIALLTCFLIETTSDFSMMMVYAYWLGSFFGMGFIVYCIMQKGKEETESPSSSEDQPTEEISEK